MIKILAEIRGEQVLIEVEETGALSSDHTVLWDERLHGVLPQIQLGKMEAYEQNNVHKLRTLSNFTESHSEAIELKNSLVDAALARNFLLETDWYIIREMDSGVACPEEIKQARAEARTKINN